MINISSVPHRSPFRYPGGKTWFVPYFRTWVKSQKKRPTTLIEPFTGGGIISLTAASESLADEIIMVEVDPQVAAVWKTIISGDIQSLINRILKFDMSMETAQEVLDSTPTDIQDIAFQTIIKNRTSHGGILATGAGLMKRGENGRGILSRWYPETIAKRLRDIVAYKNKIKFIQQDAFTVIADYSKRKDVIFFIDPPYSVKGSKSAGSRLYTHWQIDHDKLFSDLTNVEGDFILTYDNSPGVVALATKYGFCYKPVSMRNTRNVEMTELVIGKNLDWLK